MKILVAGGAGYIGSHTSIELLNAGYEVVILDNLVNSKEKVVDLIKEISGKNITFYNQDLRNKKELQKIFDTEHFDAVIHFAGLKAVGESVTKPLMYYDNNLLSTISLCEVMQESNVNNLVFSSSATVYGGNNTPPYTESMSVGSCSNPYGTTKFMIETFLKDICTANSNFNVALLRYFNPIGAHESGKIGEDPNGIPNNLVPYLVQVAVGRLPKLYLYGNDYDTPDGTCIRDYIHVLDLARGHVLALKHLETHCGVDIFNLGTGKGSSVLEMLHAMEKACGKEIPFEIAPRRAGDFAVGYADTTKANKVLGFKSEYDIDKMCIDSWNWQKNNPNGL